MRVETREKLVFTSVLIGLLFFVICSAFSAGYWWKGRKIEACQQFGDTHQRPIRMNEGVCVVRHDNGNWYPVDEFEQEFQEGEETQ